MPLRLQEGERVEVLSLHSQTWVAATLVCVTEEGEGAGTWVVRYEADSGGKMEGNVEDWRIRESEDDAAAGGVGMMSEEEMRRLIDVGVKVERCIDEQWFEAEITAVGAENGTWCVRYHDAEGNVEDDVPEDELRIIGMVPGGRDGNEAATQVEGDVVVEDVDSEDEAELQRNREEQQEGTQEEDEEKEETTEEKEAREKRTLRQRHLEFVIAARYHLMSHLSTAEPEETAPARSLVCDDSICGAVWPYRPPLLVVDGVGAVTDAHSAIGLDLKLLGKDKPLPTSSLRFVFHSSNPDKGAEESKGSGADGEGEGDDEKKSEEGQSSPAAPKLAWGKAAAGSSDQPPQVTPWALEDLTKPSFEGRRPRRARRMSTSIAMDFADTWEVPTFTNKANAAKKDGRKIVQSAASLQVSSMIWEMVPVGYASAPSRARAAGHLERLQLPVDLDFSPLGGFCARCKAPTVLRCNRCGKAFFCSRVCQRKRWRKHGEECLPLVTNVSKDPPVPLRALGLEEPAPSTPKNSGIGSSGRQAAGEATSDPTVGQLLPILDDSEVGLSSQQSGFEHRAGQVRPRDEVMDDMTVGTSVGKRSKMSGGGSSTVERQLFGDGVPDFLTGSGSNGGSGTSRGATAGSNGSGDTKEGDGTGSGSGSGSGGGSTALDEDDLELAQQLVDMLGVSRDAAIRALRANRKDMNAAANDLLVNPSAFDAPLPSSGGSSGQDSSSSSSSSGGGGTGDSAAAGTGTSGKDGDNQDGAAVRPPAATSGGDAATETLEGVLDATGQRRQRQEQQQSRQGASGGETAPSAPPVDYSSFIPRPEVPDMGTTDRLIFNIDTEIRGRRLNYRIFEGNAPGDFDTRIFITPTEPYNKVGSAAARAATSSGEGTGNEDAADTESTTVVAARSTAPAAGHDADEAQYDDSFVHEIRVEEADALCMYRVYFSDKLVEDGQEESRAMAIKEKLAVRTEPAPTAVQAQYNDQGVHALHLWYELRTRDVNYRIIGASVEPELVFVPKSQAGATGNVSGISSEGFLFSPGTMGASDAVSSGALGQMGGSVSAGAGGSAGGGDGGSSSTTEVSESDIATLMDMMSADRATARRVLIAVGGNVELAVNHMLANM